MLSFEHHWAESVLSGFAPTDAPGLSPKLGEVRYVESLLAMMRASTRVAALGLRASVWIVFFAPMWLTGRAATFGSLTLERRAALLDRMLSHRSYLVREMALLLKLAACMAIFRVSALRARSGYDRVADWQPEDVEQSGERPRVRLALAPDDDVEAPGEVA